MTITDALTYGMRMLSKTRADSLALDAEVILAHILKKSKEYIYSHSEKKLNSTQKTHFNSLITRRTKGEPIAYLVGHKEFFGLNFLITSDVLIPRPATESLVELVFSHCLPPGRGVGGRRVSSGHPGTKQEGGRKVTIIDIGTGSGCIAITLAKNLPHANIIATDITPKALTIAEKNAKRHQVENRIAFIRANLLSLSEGGCVSCPHEHMFEVSLREGNETNPTVLIANLPYLTTAQYRANPDLSWEPKNALVGGSDGIKYFKKLAQVLKKLPHLPQAIFLEIDPSQKTILKNLFSPLYRVTFKKDLHGFTRYLVLSRATQ